VILGSLFIAASAILISLRIPLIWYDQPMTIGMAAAGGVAVTDGLMRLFAK
jgi:hypothetical protein